MKTLLSKALVLSTAFFSVLSADDLSLIQSKPSVVPVESTPEPDTTEVRIAYPKNGSIDSENPLNVQIRVELYPLGFYSDFERAKEIRNLEEGQALRLIVDDQPYISINHAVDDISGSEEINLDQIVLVEIPNQLLPGEHVIRAYPVRSFGESLKDPQTLAISNFYVGEKIENPAINLKAPFLTYNEPQGSFDPKLPILLDFLVTNTQLSADGYKVRLTIDSTHERILNKWCPYYIYGLNSGTHTIKLELLDVNDTVVAPLFNDLEHVITVQ